MSTHSRMGSTQIPSSIVHMAGSRSGLCTFPPALHTRLHRWAAGVLSFMARTGTSTLWLSPFCSPVAPGSLPWFPQQGLGQLVQQNLPIPATCLSQRSGKSCKQGVGSPRDCCFLPVSTLPNHLPACVQARIHSERFSVCFSFFPRVYSCYLRAGCFARTPSFILEAQSPAT